MRSTSIVILAAFAASAVVAQTARAQGAVYRKTSVEQVAKATFDSLFAGILVDSAQAAAASARVRRCLADQYAVSALEPGFRANVAALADSRNDDLLALIRSRADSTRFLANEQRVDANLPVRRR